MQVRFAEMRKMRFSEQGLLASGATLSLNQAALTLATGGVPRVNLYQYADHRIDVAGTDLAVGLGFVATIQKCGLSATSPRAGVTAPAVRMASPRNCTYAVMALTDGCWPGIVRAALAILQRGVSWLVITPLEFRRASIAG